jgi:transposase
MYIESVPNRNSPPCILLRESRREGRKVVKRTLLNLTSWPPELIEDFRRLLKGGRVVEDLSQAFEVVRSLAHGHVAAVWGTLRKIGLLSLLGRRPSRPRSLAAALIAARVLEPRSKLATARGLDRRTAASTLSRVAGVEDATAEELYAALDWLLERQPAIEKQLARLHLDEGDLVLYDLTSAYFEGRRCPLARLGYSRDGKKGKPQIVVGLICNREGCPVAVEVFEGNTADPSTLSAQIDKLRRRFGLRRVVVVGDRGLITSARIREDLSAEEGIDWITALRAPQIARLLDRGELPASLFDERDLAEISSPEFPGERLVVCRNPFLADERARKREELLQATEAELSRIVQAVERPRRALRGKAKIGLRAGRVLHKFKMGKHFELEIGDDFFRFRRKSAQIEREASLDGIYVVRTSVPAKQMSADQVVGSYKGLSVVERAFRCTKTMDLKLRPIYHRLPDRVRAHVFLCMLAYYVEWHMRQSLAPILFDDDDRRAAARMRRSVVAPAERSPSAQLKARTRLTQDGLPVHSFPTLLADLATIVQNTVQPKLPGADSFLKTTVPSPLQQRALDLLGVRL